ncbi:MAG: substrate-binding domain-containing protein [Symbiobacterium sp.]|uniref:sugar ABC transporter substrate-binding protein n=1 Tax=Symbiobacterium sp. TaxID=1971213 RepID=UPI0034640AD2
MRKLTVLLMGLALSLAACAAREAAPSEAQPDILIGFSMDTLQEERWQRDRDLFVARARELGADVIVQAASGDSFLQMSQAENMIARGVDVLVVVAHDAEAMRPIVSEARAAGVKVVAYDRLIRNVDLDFYLAFDHEWAGFLQAQYLADQMPQGRYVLLGGAPADDQAWEVRKGIHRVLDPLQERGDIEIVLEEMVEGWSAEAAEALVETLLPPDAGAPGEDAADAPTPRPIDVIIAADDALAGGAVAALSRHGLAGQVLVAGQNADLEAMQRILAGTQTMTVYKPIRQLAATAAEVAVALARGEHPSATRTTFNGKDEVPTLVLEPVTVDRSNWLDTVVADGFHRKEDILGIPH